VRPVRKTGGASHRQGTDHLCLFAKSLTSDVLPRPCNTPAQGREHENNKLKYLPLIWSAICRKPAESVLTLLAVTVAFMLFGLMIGLQGMYQTVVDSARMDRLLIFARYPDGSPNGMPLAMEEQVAHIDGVRAVGSNKGWVAFYRDRTNAYFLQGFTEGMREAYSELPLTRTQWSELFATQNGAVITRKAAERMKLKEGDPFPVFMNAPQGEVMNADLVVTSVIDDTPEWGDLNVLVNFRFIEQLRPPEQRGLIWELRAAVDPEHAIDVARRIDRYFATSGTPTLSTPAKVWTLRRANAGLPVTAITWTVGVVGMLVVLLLVGNGIADSVQERTAELAVLNTLGFGHDRLRGLVFAEALFPCLVGAIVGTTLAPLLAVVPLRLLPPGTGADPDPTVWVTAIAWAVACAVLIALASAAIPMLRLARLNVADALAGR
jgi:putative ABC transport system permease protein